MFQLIFLALLTIPIIEIYLILQVGHVIGAPLTILLLIGLALLGTRLLRQQGTATLRRVQSTLAAGQMPAMELLEGMAILVAGVLLVTPGFFTDAVGLLLLLPPVRRAAIAFVLSRGVAVVTGSQPRTPQEEPRRSAPRTLEGEWQREDEHR